MGRSDSGTRDQCAAHGACVAAHLRVADAFPVAAFDPLGYKRPVRGSLGPMVQALRERAGNSPSSTASATRRCRRDDARSTLNGMRRYERPVARC